MNILEKVRWGKNIISHQKTLPEQVTFFVTNRCNLRCKHCFYWQNLNKTTKEFTLEELKKVVPTIGRFSFLSLGGGEPFLRDDLAEIVKLFVEINKVSRISIPTNGFLTERILDSTREMLKVTKKAKVLVKVSFDGIAEEHDNIRGVKGSFDNAVRTFLQLKELTQEYTNFKLGVILTLSRLNEHSLLDAYACIKDKLSPDIVGLNFVRGNTKEDSIKQVDLKNYQVLYSTILQDLLKEKRDNGVFYDFYSAYKSKVCELISEIVQTKKYPLKCYAGKLSAVIDSSLDIFPCENLDKKMGNLRDYDYDFRRLWFSRDSSTIREYIANSDCWCTCECNLQINSFFNFKELLPLVVKTVKYRLNLD